MVPFLVIQVIFDFTGWFIWLGEKNGHWYNYTWKEWLFRFLKVVVDFPLTIYIALQLGIGVNEIAIFYLAKWLGVCDLFYLIIHILWTGKKLFNEAWWLWWTPYGLYEKLRGYNTITN